MSMLNPYGRRPQQNLPQSKPCAICSRPSKRVCKACGKNVCDIHYDSLLAMCTSCAQKRRRTLALETERSKTHPGLHAEHHGMLCHICNQEAEHTCPVCGKPVCPKHYKADVKMCVMCANKKTREEGRAVL